MCRSSPFTSSTARGVPYTSISSLYLLTRGSSGNASLLYALRVFSCCLDALMMLCYRVLVSLDLPLLTPELTRTGSAFFTAFPSLDMRSVMISAIKPLLFWFKSSYTLLSVIWRTPPFTFLSLIRNYHEEPSKLFIQGNHNCPSFISSSYSQSLSCLGIFCLFWFIVFSIRALTPMPLI